MTLARGLIVGVSTPGLVRTTQPAGLVAGTFLDTFTEAGPGDISQGVPHTPNIDQNPNGLDWVQELGAAPGGLAVIDSAIDALVPPVTDGTTYGGAQQFRLSNVLAFEVVTVGDLLGATAGNQVISNIADATFTKLLQTGIFPSGVAPGDIQAGAVINVPGVGLGQVVDGLAYAPGDKTVTVALYATGVMAVKLDGRTTLYANMAGVLTAAAYQFLVAGVSATGAGTHHTSVLVHNPTLPVPAGGSGNFLDNFDQDGLLTGSTPAADPFGAGWQFSPILPSVTGAPTVASGELTWGLTEESADVPLGGFGKAFEVTIPVTFGSDDGASGSIGVSAVGQFGTGLTLRYMVKTGGTEVQIDMYETGIGENNLIDSATYANPGTDTLVFAYKESSGLAAHKLGANTTDSVATARDMAARHLLIDGKRISSAHTWASVAINQTPTII